MRYGNIPQVARYDAGDTVIDELVRGMAVVVQTDRGLELGDVLDVVPPSLADGHQTAGAVVRLATEGDQTRYQQLQSQAETSYAEWQTRVLDWKLELELVDVEYTLEGEKCILYVLNDRGPETTRLALLAAAAGLGIVTVQPVSADGLTEQGGGGCGSGCGCGH